MDNKYINKNGGFPPLRYCPDDDKDVPIIKSKERLFANTPKDNVDIKTLLLKSVSNKPLFIEPNNDEILIVSD